MTDAGIGARQLNKLVTTMGIPGITPKTLKRREREMKVPLYDVTRDSCRQAIEKEIEIMRERVPKEDEAITPEGFKLKYDMCWQKRGCGRAYNSPSGVGSIIGLNTGKVLAFDICSVHCRTCGTADQIGKQPEDHECTKNWDKSAKAMEADTAARLIKGLEKTTGVPLDTLIMDDDSSTLAKLRQDLARNIDKWSDINHSTRSLSNALYTLKNKHKLITKDVIDHLKLCFSYAIHQNKDNPSGLAENLQAIVPHCFDIHDKCGMWCKASNQGYVFKSFVNGKPLIGDDLFKDLCTIFKTMANNSTKLAPCGSTKDVESLHNIYASKAPKRVCYSSSESLSVRVNASIAQKNIGYSYLSVINERAGLSPGKVTKKNALQLERERKRQLEYYHNPEVKKRKIEKKMKGKKKLKLQEQKEGVTYKSGMGLNIIAECSSIPCITYKPELEKVSKGVKPTVVVFDLETSSLTEDCAILQLAAKSINGPSFQSYIQPKKTISPSSSAITGLTSDGEILFYHGKPVSTCTEEEAYQNFILWLEDKSPVLLVGHNSRSFDSRRLIFNISNYSCFAAFKNNVIGFADTLPLFKKVLQLENYKQENIYRHVIGEEYNAHNAVDDVLSLEKVLITAKVDIDMFINESFTTDSLLKQINYSKQTKLKVLTFDPLIKGKFASNGIVHKMAESGLEISHLVLAHQRNGQDGIKELLGEPRMDQKPRVTKNKTVLDKLLKYFIA